MGGLMGGLSMLFGSGATSTVLLAGVIVCLLFRPDRIVDQEKFRLSVILLVVSLAIPALLGMFAGPDSMGGGGIILRLFYTAEILTVAGATYLFISSITNIKN